MPRPRHPSRAEVESTVAKLALAYGWEHHHARCAGITQDGYIDGFPADVLYRDGCLLFVLTAAADGDLTLPEARWATRLGAVQVVEAKVVRCVDLQALAQFLRMRPPGRTGSAAAEYAETAGSGRRVAGSSRR
jgi:hypothetical protein